MGTSRRRGAEELRRTLTRERVVAEALTVIAQEGVEALTMRTLGARLGVVPGALYRHARGKEQLQDLIVDGVLVEVAQVDAFVATLPAGEPQRVE